MNAKELRIGNYVEFENRIFQIDTIAEVFPTLNTDEFGIGVVDWNNLKPIPLTEEWLIKFGFEQLKKTIETIFVKDNFIWYSSINEILVEFDSTVTGSYTLDTNCKYVHQLQNLYFALTGEELITKTEIENL